MQLFPLVTLALIAPSLAIPCQTQMTYYNVNNREATSSLQICWDTTTKTCKGGLAKLTRKPGANSVITCTNNNGNIHWHLGTGWTLFDHDLLSFDIDMEVSTTECKVVRYKDYYTKIVGLPYVLWRTDDKPIATQTTCGF